MARVNHKKIRQLASEKRSRITDRQFFVSRGLAGHFEDIAAAQTGRHDHDRRVHVSISWKPGSQETACTDNRKICINAGHPLVTKVRGRQGRYWQVCGMFAHELAHVLYTDFLCSQSYQKALSGARWFPAAPDLRNAAERTSEKEIWDFVKEDEVNMGMFIQLAHQISNVLEDGHIEHRFLNEYPGRLGYGLEMHRKRKWEVMPTVTQMKEQEEEDGTPVFESILQNMLSYSLFGEIKYGDEPLSDERIAAVFRLIDEIDEAVMTTSAKARLMAVNTIMVRLWKYIRDYLEDMKEHYNEALASGSGQSAGEFVSGSLSGLSGATSIGSGSGGGAGDGDDGITVPVAISAAGRSKTHADAEGSGTGGDNDVEEDDTGEGQGEETDDGEDTGEEDTVDGKEDSDDVTDTGEDTPAFPDADKETGEGAPAFPGAAQENGEDDGLPLLQGRADSRKKGASTGEQGRIPLQNTSGVSMPEGGTVTRNEDYAGEYNEHAASDIERILDREAEEQACEELENERVRELNEMAQNISYGNIHEGVPVTVQRMSRAGDDMKEQYDRIAGPLSAISKQMQKSIARQLKDRRQGGKLTGLMFGRRLDTHALCRNDGKAFYKNTLPNEVPELAVGLLLDESGSMSSCDRCTYARATAIILYDFCRGLDIPVMVYGHSTGYDEKDRDTVELYSYAEFDSIDQDDRYRMMDIDARGGNRDGAALRYVAEQLIRRPEDVKLLMIVSDGQPADNGYYGTAAEEDLRGIRQEYMRKGVVFVAAAIGDDKENIERIYGDSFMDITDLEQLPVKLTGVVKRHIRM